MADKKPRDEIAAGLQHWDAERQRRLPNDSDHQSLDPEIERELGEQIRNQIDAGVWPPVVDFAMEVSSGPQGLNVRYVPAADGEPDRPEGMILRGTVNLEPRVIAEKLCNRIREDFRAGQPVLTQLAATLLLDSECFLAVSSQFFADVLQANDLDWRVDNDFGEFVAGVCHNDSDLISQLVDRTQAIHPVAGDRLRLLMLAPLSEPSWADRIGHLTAAALREQLERE